jgi:hypothetical protein
MKPRRRRFLDDFLIAPLHRAIALAQCDDVAAPVAEDLHFDVPRVFDELLDEYSALAEVAGS